MGREAEDRSLPLLVAVIHLTRLGSWRPSVCYSSGHDRDAPKGDVLGIMGWPLTALPPSEAQGIDHDLERDPRAFAQTEGKTVSLDGESIDDVDCDD
jgi:hypothetical protein